MVVRGAPAIGITAAYGMAIAQKNEDDMIDAYCTLAASRPTAVNLKWALDRVRKIKSFLSWWVTNVKKQIYLESMCKFIMWSMWNIAEIAVLKR